MENYKKKYLKYKKKYNNLKKNSTITIKKLTGGSYKMELYKPGNTEPISCSFKIPNLNYFKICLLKNLNTRGITEEQKKQYDIDYFNISNVEVRLVHLGKIIETNEDLEKVCQESCDVFYALKKIDTINVNIRPLIGEHFTIKTRNTMNVRNLIENIKKTRNLNIEFDLIYSGNKLDNFKKLVDYNIENNSIIVLMHKIESGFRLGHGRLTLPGGVYYIGPVSFDVPHGIGKEYYPNGKLKYEGKFVNGLKEGYGKYIHSDGAYYTGPFVNDVPHGIGKEYDNNSILRYEGNFVDGKKHGKGTTYDDNGVLVYEGNFVNNVPHEFGTEYFEGLLSYSGNYVNGKKQGEGIYYYEGNKIYEGDFDDDRFHGVGIRYNLEGNKIYEGDFFNGKKQGKGIDYYDNGNKIYEGDFDDNLWHGEGTLYDDNGVIVYEGNFVNGVED